MELDTHELFHCQAYDRNYRDEKLCYVSKADCIAWDYILLSKLWGSWRFLKFSEALYVYSKQNFYVHNHVSQKAKGEISNWDIIPNRETAIQVQAMFPTKNTLTIDNDDQKFNCDNANGHSQTGNWKKYIGKLNLKDKPKEQKQREAPWDFVYTPLIEHLFTQTSFNCGFDRYKVIDCFKVQLVNWRLLLFQWCKMPFKHIFY